MNPAVSEISENALRWQSRRGTLELDLTLQKFWREVEGRLSASDLRALAALLQLDDEDLRQVVVSGGDAEQTMRALADPRERAALEQIVRRLQRL